MSDKRLWIRPERWDLDRSFDQLVVLEKRRAKRRAKNKVAKAQRKKNR